MAGIGPGTMTVGVREGAADQTAESQLDLKVWPGHHGIFTEDSRSGDVCGWFGPPDDERDRGPDMAEPTPPPPLQLYRPLTSTDLSAMQAQGVSAATHYGVPRQDKQANQDFACAAAWVDGETGVHLRFAAVADGVSNKTLWAGRGARIAGLTAYQVARDWGGRLFGPDASPQTDAAFLHDLTTALRAAFHADRTVLQTSKTYDKEWREDIYRSVMRREEFWYNTTLLFTVATATDVFSVAAGDGAIVYLPQSGETQVFTKSGASMLVTSWVSLVVSEAMFRTERQGASVADGMIALMTDGADRTFQLRAADRANADYRVALTERTAREVVEALCAAPDVDHDNLSVALIDPLQDKPNAQPTSRRLGRQDVAKANKSGGRFWLTVALLALLILSAVGAVVVGLFGLNTILSMLTHVGFVWTNL